jgi:ribosome-associated protein
VTAAKGAAPKASATGGAASKVAATKTAAARSAASKADGKSADGKPAARTRSRAAGGRKKAPPESRRLAELVSRAANEHRLLSPILLNLTGIPQVTDFFYIATAESARQIRRVGEDMVLWLKGQGVLPLSVDGLSSPDTRWAVLDFGDVMVHLFQKETRELYDLEGLWADAPREDPATLLKPAGRRSA